MFHVKHFGLVAAKNLTKLKTAASPSIRKIDQFFGAIGIGQQLCLDSADG